MGTFRRKKRAQEQEPLLRLSLESGVSHDDPSEDLLFMAFEDVQHGREEFLIVERVSDRSGQTYAQAAPNGDGGFVVEHRAGSADRHFSTDVADFRAAHALVTGWAFELSGWDTGTEWQRRTFH